MTTGATLLYAVADALIEEYGRDATEWIEGGGRADIERRAAEWREAIEAGRWIERPEDILVLRALRRVEHTVALPGGPDTELIREFMDEDHGRRRPGAATRIGEVPPMRSFATTRASRSIPSAPIGASTGARSAATTRSRRRMQPRRSRAGRLWSKRVSPGRAMSSGGCRSRISPGGCAKRRRRRTRGARTDGCPSRTGRCSATCARCARTERNGSFRPTCGFARSTRSNSRAVRSARWCGAWRGSEASSKRSPRRRSRAHGGQPAPSGRSA